MSKAEKDINALHKDVHLEPVKGCWGCEYPVMRYGEIHKRIRVLSEQRMHYLPAPKLVRTGEKFFRLYGSWHERKTGRRGVDYYGVFATRQEAEDFAAYFRDSDPQIEVIHVTRADDPGHKEWWLAEYGETWRLEMQNGEVMDAFVIAGRQGSFLFMHVDTTPAEQAMAHWSKRDDEAFDKHRGIKLTDERIVNAVKVRESEYPEKLLDIDSLESIDEMFAGKAYEECRSCGKLVDRYISSKHVRKCLERARKKRAKDAEERHRDAR